MITTSVYYSCYTCDGEEIISNVDDLKSNSEGNTPIVQIKLNAVDDDHEDEHEDDRDDGNTCPDSRSNTIQVNIRDVDLERTDAFNEYDDSRVHKQDQRKDALKGKRVSNIQNQAEELKCTIDKIKKKISLRRSDRLYMLGKQSVSKRRECHYNQIAEERKRNTQIEKSLEKKRISSRSTLTPSSSRSRAIRLYELSRPKQIEGKLRREKLNERAKARNKDRFSCDVSSICSSTASASTASSLSSLD